MTIKLDPTLKLAIEEILRQRNSSSLTESEADFVAGAIAVLVAWLGPEVEIPPMWCIAPMSGRPIFSDCPPPTRQAQKYWGEEDQ